MKSAGLILGAALCGASPALAEEVSLAHEGEVVATGDLLGYDGRYYRILGEYGEVTLDGNLLTCSGPGCPESGAIETFRISGEAGIVDAVLPPLIETFAQRRGYGIAHGKLGTERRYTLSEGGEPRAEIILSATSSSEGLADIIADATDLAVTLRTPDAVELDLARQAGRGDLRQATRRAILGLDGVVPVVSAMSARRSIDLAEIGGWAPTNLHVPAPGTGAGDAVRRHFPGLPAETVLHDDLRSLTEAVARDPAALGLTLHSAIGDTQALSLSGPCGARIGADQLTLKTEDYPLSAPVFLYAPARRITGVARDFVAYATSPIAQPVIRRAGLVDQFPVRIAFEDQGSRLGLAILSTEESVALAGLRRLVLDMRDGSRLTLSYRFEDGSSRLDAQSQDNVDRLAAAIRLGLFNGRRLIFAGFTDGGGSAGLNRRLSRQRAEAVRDAVAEAAPGTDVRLEAAAYGEALPIACDEVEWGRRVNRRVEVWIGPDEATGSPRLEN